MKEQNGSGLKPSKSGATILSSSITASHHVDPRLRLKVITIALYSRLTVVALAAICDLLVPNHDAGAFTWTPSTNGGVSSPTLCDRLVSLISDGLTLRYNIDSAAHILI